MIWMPEKGSMVRKQRSACRISVTLSLMSKVTGGAQEVVLYTRPWLVVVTTRKPNLRTGEGAIRDSIKS